MEKIGVIQQNVKDEELNKIDLDKLLKLISTLTYEQ